MDLRARTSTAPLHDSGQSARGTALVSGLACRKYARLDVDPRLTKLKSQNSRGASSRPSLTVHTARERRSWQLGEYFTTRPFFIQ